MSNSFDPQMIIDGCNNSTIAFDVAVQLFKENIETARYFLPDFLNHEMMVIIYKEKKAKPLLRKLPAWVALQLYWKLFEAQTVLGLCAGHNLPITNLFAEDMLHDHHEDIPESVLQNIRENYPDPQIARLAYACLQLSLNRKTRARMQNPAEINRDVESVKTRITEYHFNPELNEILGKIADELAAGGDEYDQAANLKHLRTFFEKLHEQVGTALRIAKPGISDRADVSKFGQALDYLERNGVLTPKMRELPKGLYGILSNEGVHAFKSEKEYVRLCRNMVIEYAIVLFFELERRLR